MLVLNRDAFLGQSQKILFCNISSYLSLPLAPAALLEYSFSSFPKNQLTFPPPLLMGADVRHTQTPSFCQLTLYIGAGRAAHRGERWRAGGRGLWRKRRAATLRNAHSSPSRANIGNSRGCWEGERSQQPLACARPALLQVQGLQGPGAVCVGHCSHMAPGQCGAAACPPASGRAGISNRFAIPFACILPPPRAILCASGLRRWLV